VVVAQWWLWLRARGRAKVAVVVASGTSVAYLRAFIVCNKLHWGGRFSLTAKCHCIALAARHPAEEKEFPMFVFANTHGQFFQVEGLNDWLAYEDAVAHTAAGRPFGRRNMKRLENFYGVKVTFVAVMSGPDCEWEGY
jgi:hypothetical protein